MTNHALQIASDLLIVTFQQHQYKVDIDECFICFAQDLYLLVKKILFQDVSLYTWYPLLTISDENKVMLILAETSL